MAKYEGTYTCGHDGVAEVFGKVSERQYWIDREFSKRCPDCHEKGRAIEIEKANEKSREAAEKMKLPELKGSEKQVAWATTLRQKFIEEWEATCEEFEIRINELKEEHKELARKEVNTYKETYENLIRNVVHSSFWIDHKNKEARMLINNVVQFGIDNA